MNSPSSHSTVTRAELLRHEPYVRRLAAGLVSDPSRADDIAQESWLKALRRPPRHAVSLRGWFRSVVRCAGARVLEKEAVRAAREGQVEAPIQATSVLDEISMQQLREVLTDELAALEGLYREVLTLRFLEDRPAAEVAQILGVPLATVRTRIRRGLERLRERLDRRFGGDRSAWSQGMLALALGGKAAPSSAAALALPLCLLGGLILLLGFRFYSGPSRGRRETVQPQAVSMLSTLSAVDSRSRRSAAASEVDPILPTPLSMPGGVLLATLRWEDDGGPAQGQRLLLEGPRTTRTAVTDGQGRARIEGLAPGAWRVAAAGGDPRWVELIDAAEVSVDISLRPGRTLRGRVRAKRQESVAGATVFASFPDRPDLWAQWSTVGEDGLFQLSAVDPRATVGVVQGDRGQFFDLDQPACDGLEEVELYLTLRKGVLEGRVVDPSGEPIAGARITAEDTGLLRPMVREDGILRLARSAHSVVSDEQGLFRVTNFGVRPPVLRVTAPGYAARRLMAAPGEPIVLTPAGSLEGSFSWPDGTPAAFAQVSTRGGMGEWISTRCDGEGRFELTGLPTGRLELRVRAREGMRCGEGRFYPNLRVGGCSQWRGILGETEGLHGRLIDGRGNPLIGWRLCLDPQGEGESPTDPRFENSGGEQGRVVFTGARGEFHFGAVDAGGYRLRVFDPSRPGRVILTQHLSYPAESLCIVAPDPGESRIRGTLVWPGGAVPPNARLVLSGTKLEEDLSVPVEESTGAFETPLLIPGRYRATAWWPGHHPVELAAPLEASAAGVQEVGRLAVPGDGRLRITLEAGVEGRGSAARVLVCKGKLPLYQAALSHADPSILTPPLPPGPYQVTAWNLDGMPAARTATVIPGEVVDLRFDEIRGGRDLLIYLAEPPSEPGELVIEIATEDGRGLPVQRLPVGRSEGGPFELAGGLPDCAAVVIATLRIPGAVGATQRGRKCFGACSESDPAGPATLELSLELARER